MRASRRVLAAALLCFSNLCLPILAAAQSSDQVIAERILGPQWRQLSRRAGMIFAGTVLATGPEPVATVGRTLPGAIPAIQLRLRVDAAIAGVEHGQVLTIREWTGAQSMHRPMNPGQHILLFLYPLSRLGLTSPVGGSRGQVFLDPSGKNVSRSGGVSVLQLERAIRRARSEEEQ